jgi:hypothetical protein
MSLETVITSIVPYLTNVALEFELLVRSAQPSVHACVMCMMCILSFFKLHQKWKMCLV